MQELLDYHGIGLIGQEVRAYVIAERPLTVKAGRYCFLVQNGLLVLPWKAHVSTADHGFPTVAAKAGMWEHEGLKYAKIQILHVKEILEDSKFFHTPSRVGLKIASRQMTLGL